MKNLSVLARNSLDGLFYKGYVSTPVKTLEAKRVVFEYITPQEVEYEYIIPIGGAIPWPELQPGDTVLVRVFNRPSGIVNYVPGTVLHLPNSCHDRKYFTVLIYTRNQVFALARQRKDLIKIGKEFHKDILDYIYIIRSKSNKIIAPEPGKRLCIRREKRSNPFIIVNVHPSTEKNGKSSPENKKEDSTKKEEQTKLPPVTEKPGQQQLQNVHVHLAPPHPPPANKPPTMEDKSINTEKETDSEGDSTVEEPSVRLELTKNQVVLARWKDDGWYYYGKYQDTTEEGCYRVMDRTGYSEIMQADDIILEEKYIFEPRDRVVALHKEHVSSYAPGVIDHIYKGVNSEFARVKFYDGTIRDVPIKDLDYEMFKIDPQKYKDVVNYIKDCENRVVKIRTVVARDEKTGFFRSGDVIDRDTKTNMYTVRLNGETRKVPSLYLFHKDWETKREDIYWKFALVPTDSNGTKIYIPAQVENHSPIRVKLCTQEKTVNLSSLKSCFYISESFYTNSVDFINDRKARKRDQGRQQ